MSEHFTRREFGCIYETQIEKDLNDPYTVKFVEVYKEKSKDKNNYDVKSLNKYFNIIFEEVSQSVYDGYTLNDCKIKNENLKNEIVENVMKVLTCLAINLAKARLSLACDGYFENFDSYSTYLDCGHETNTVRIRLGLKRIHDDLDSATLVWKERFGHNLESEGAEND